jgi:hypothetical protein
MLPAGQRVEYKYVILEEQVSLQQKRSRLQAARAHSWSRLTHFCLGFLQDWTKLENEDAQGIVEVTYRTGSEAGRPPDVQVISRQMAIVAWQPGPNRVIQVPTEVSTNNMAPAWQGHF